MEKIMTSGTHADLVARLEELASKNGCFSAAYENCIEQGAPQADMCLTCVAATAAKALAALPPPADPPALVALRKSLLTGLEAIRQFASPHAQHTNRCNGDDDTPCDCGAINPRDVAESLYEQVLAYPLPAAPPVPETPQGKRCADCAEIAEAVNYYTGEDVDVLVDRYRSESSAAPAVPPQEAP